MASRSLYLRLPRKTLLDVLHCFRWRIDLTSELLGLPVRGPVNMRAHERHIFVIGLAAGIEDFYLAADRFEDLAVEGRVAGRQRGRIEPMFLVLAPTGIIAGRIRRTSTTSQYGQAQTENADS
jgi:hypothetical protein